MVCKTLQLQARHRFLIWQPTSSTALSSKKVSATSPHGKGQKAESSAFEHLLTMIHAADSNKSSALPIRRSRGTASSTLYPLHQTRALLRHLRPGSTAAPITLVDACLLNARNSPEDTLHPYSNNDRRTATSNNNYNLVEILDQALNILQDDHLLCETEEPSACFPHRNNNNNNPTRQWG